MGRLFIFFGAPGSGKSLCLDHLAAGRGDFRTVKKQTTRLPRDTDREDIESVKVIAPDCDFRYSQYSFEYGFKSHDIWVNLASGFNCALIANDLRTIKLLKRQFGPLARSIYLHSNIDKEMLTLVMRRRYPDRSAAEIASELERRVEKIKTVHRKYIENTVEFDYTILNVFEEPDDEEAKRKLFMQLQRIVEDPAPLPRRVRSLVKVFVIVGGSFSGKDELVEAMQMIDKGKINNYRKATDRPRRPSDKGELRHFPEGVPQEFTLLYRKQGFVYGISKGEIWETLAQGSATLLVASDFATIDELKREFGAICTVIFLHANFNVAEIRAKMREESIGEAETEERLQFIEELHGIYVSELPLFDHVLLNTAEPEDLYDQAFNIVDYYRMVGF